MKTHEKEDEVRIQKGIVSKKLKSNAHANAMHDKVVTLGVEPSKDSTRRKIRLIAPGLPFTVEMSLQQGCGTSGMMTLLS